jgi:hypothetical protein
MDNISYEQLIENLDSFFQNYTKIELTSGMMPKIGFNGFLDLRYVKEDIIICKNIQYNKNGVDVLLPSHIVSIDFSQTKNFRFLYFPNSLKKIIIYRAEGIEPKLLFPMYNLPDLPNELLLLSCRKCGLNNIPPLSQTLKLLDCSDNKSISRIPELPIGLMVLRCDNTTITQLPELPEGLIELTFGVGGKDKPLYFPEKLPINLEEMNIGSEDVFFSDEWVSGVRADPESEVVLEPGEKLTPQTIDKYIAKMKAESDSNYTTFINPESFTEFPPNLKNIMINGTNLSSFPIKLPDIWNTATTEEFVTEKPNPQINAWNPYPIIQIVNFSIYISGNIGINLLQQKYLPLLQNIKNLLIKHNIQPKKYLLNYYGYDNQRMNLDDLINRLQVENHTGFNAVVMDNKGILTSNPKLKPMDSTTNSNTNTNTQPISLPASLNPQISQYLSSNQELQAQTINNSKGGKHKKSKRLKMSKNKKTKSKK